MFKIETDNEESSVVLDSVGDTFEQTLDRVTNDKRNKMCPYKECTKMCPMNEDNHCDAVRRAYRAPKPVISGWNKTKRPARMDFSELAPLTDDPALMPQVGDFGGSGMSPDTIELN